MTKSVDYLTASPKYDRMIQDNENNRISFDWSRLRTFYPRVDSGWLHTSRPQEHMGLDDLALGQS